MSITYDKIYPMKTVGSSEDSLLTEAQIAQGLLTKIVDEGKDEPTAVGEVLSECVGAGTHSPGLINEVLDRLKRESLVVRSIDPTKYQTANEYTGAIEMLSELLSSVEWLEKLKAAHEAATWDGLLVKLSDAKAVLDAQKL